MTHQEMARRAELRKLTKPALADRHLAAGGLMARRTYLTWTKDELIDAVIEDEQAAK